MLHWGYLNFFWAVCRVAAMSGKGNGQVIAVDRARRGSDDVLGRLEALKRGAAGHLGKFVERREGNMKKAVDKVAGVIVKGAATVLGGLRKIPGLRKGLKKTGTTGACMCVACGKPIDLRSMRRRALRDCSPMR
jgi:hypothetical protein